MRVRPDRRGPGADQRDSALEMDAEEFRRAGHAAVDAVAEFLAGLRERPVTRSQKPSQIRMALPQGGLPAEGRPAGVLLEESAHLLFDHSLLNGHPRFLGYITSSAAPIGALADLLAGAVNPNCGGWALSPVASEIERQTIAWIAELVGYPPSCGGLLVSGGNMANFVGFLAARKARVPWDVRAEGLRGRPQLTVYLSVETHTWIQKAADLFGLGAAAVRWIGVDGQRRIDLTELERRIVADRQAGCLPFLVVASAGTVETGAIDPLPAMAEICRRHGLWFHVDGAYGAPAVCLPDAPADLAGIAEADSVAVDPHKWLYSPLEAGCALVREAALLTDAFSFRPEYYAFQSPDGEERFNFYEAGFQNSRGFRALKVWLGLRHAGRAGLAQMIGDDCALARALFDAVKREEELEASTQSLSITTFRYVPRDLRRSDRTDAENAYLNDLNTEILSRLQAGGEAFVSNAVVDGVFLLRACIVNFRTRLRDVEALPRIVLRLGREVDAEKRGAEIRRPG
jgi:aromatic-L-amino-acid/L-tryptophan decarboxylase